MCGDCNVIGGCNLVTLFGSDCYNGWNAVIGVQHTEVPYLGASWSVVTHFGNDSYDSLNAVTRV